MSHRLRMRALTSSLPLLESLFASCVFSGSLRPRHCRQAQGFCLMTRLASMERKLPHSRDGIGVMPSPRQLALSAWVHVGSLLGSPGLLLRRSQQMPLEELQ